MPISAYECMKLSNGTYLLYIYALVMGTVGTNSLPIGRTLTDIRAYANQNLLVTDLKVLIG
jgi:hypothetical protein